MKLYINPKLEIRANENGWPEHPKFPMTQYTSGFWDDFYKALEKAKAESVLFEDQKQIWTVLESPAFGNRDSFTEADIEVEFVWQYFDEVSKEWFDYHKHTSKAQIFNRETRTIARLKPASLQVDPEREAFEDGLDRTLNLQQENEQLRAQLAAAEKTLQEKQIIINNYAHFFESMRGLVLDSFNHITDADNPYQALERAFDRLSIR